MYMNWNLLSTRVILLHCMYVATQNIINTHMHMYVDAYVCMMVKTLMHHTRDSIIKPSY